MTNVVEGNGFPVEETRKWVAEDDEMVATWLASKVTESELTASAIQVTDVVLTPLSVRVNSRAMRLPDFRYRIVTGLAP